MCGPPSEPTTTTTNRTARTEAAFGAGRLDHRDEFERAWSEAGNTRFELPPVDINRVLAERYRTDRRLVVTGEMLWDVEVRKAWRPDRYIPSVVSEGSARTWGGRSTPEGNDTFLRASVQRRWLDPSAYALVLENTRLDFRAWTATFIGVAELTTADGSVLQAEGAQPLFHVEHSVGGEAQRPLNRWRIVHLTDDPDSRLLEPFERIAENAWLPEFLEIYLRDDLGIGLERRESG